MRRSFIALEDLPNPAPHGREDIPSPAAPYGLLSRRRSRVFAVLMILFGWTITLLIVLAFFAALYFYSEEMPIMSTPTKREFNTIITGLSIGLGLSLTHGLNETISILRWWILSRRYYSLRKVELILQAESLRHVFLLACRTRSFRMISSVAFWLVLMLGTQVGLAMIGFCYSVEVADKNALVIYAGKVVVPDMSELQMVDELHSKSASSSALEYLANRPLVAETTFLIQPSSYGQMSLAYSTSTLDDIPGVAQLRDSEDPLVFCGVENCYYVFYEMSEEADDDNTMRLTAATSRRINSTATCESWPILGFSEDKPGHISLDTGNSSPSDIFFPLPDGANQTTFLTNTSISCGAGCRVVSAVETSEMPTWYYNCTVLVGTVTGASLPEHEVGDSIRNLAAEGIAMQGFQATSRLSDASLQFQVYPMESVFGLPTRGLANAMAMKMARFAIGIVAVTAASNPQITTRGNGASARRQARC